MKVANNNSFTVICNIVTFLQILQTVTNIFDLNSQCHANILNTENITALLYFVHFNKTKKYNQTY